MIKNISKCITDKEIIYQERSKNVYTYAESIYYTSSCYESPETVNEEEWVSFNNLFKKFKIKKKIISF